MKDIQKELSRAKILMMGKKNAVFFSTLCMSLETIITKDIPTAATNGKYIKYNPDFFLSLTEEERIFLLAHETCHVVFLHMTRRKDRDPYLWNVAGDYVINLMLQEQGFKVIKGALLDQKYKDMTTEEVYDSLVESGESLELPWNDVEEADQDLSEADKKEIARQIEGAVIRAKTIAEMSGAGVMPEGIKRLFSEILNPKLPWQTILRRFVKNVTSKADYSWQKPNTKYGVLLPSLRSPRVGQIDVAIDTSGSIGPDDFNQLIAELFGILKQCKPEKVGVIQFDHELRGNDIAKTAKDLQKVAFSGGGGTLASRAYEGFKQNHASHLMIIITDGWIHPRDQLPRDEKRPVLWAVYNNPQFHAPNGKDKVIHFKV